MICSDFHMHTRYVDGKNSPEEMICHAIELGYHTIGISEHAYVPFDVECSMSQSELIRYRDELIALKAKYDGVITVLSGIEMDYYSEDYAYNYDYVIGSVHYLKVRGETYGVDVSPKETRRCVDGAFGGDFDGYYEAYFEMLSGICDKTNASVVGHFDLPTKFCDTLGKPSGGRYERAWRHAAEALRGKAALEINTGAISRGYRHTPYPAGDVLTLWNKSGGDVIISSDAHRAENIGFGFEEACSVAEINNIHSFAFTDLHGIRHLQ